MCICSIIKSEEFLKNLLAAQKPKFKKLINTAQSREVACVIELIINSSYIPPPTHIKLGSYKNKKLIAILKNKSKLSLRRTRDILVQYHSNVKHIVSSVYSYLLKSEVIRLQITEP